VCVCVCVCLCVYQGQTEGQRAKNLSSTQKANEDLPQTHNGPHARCACMRVRTYEYVYACMCQGKRGSSDRAGRERKGRWGGVMEGASKMGEGVREGRWGRGRWRVHGGKRGPVREQTRARECVSNCSTCRYTCSASNCLSVGTRVVNSKEVRGRSHRYAST